MYPELHKSLAQVEKHLRDVADRDDHNESVQDGVRTLISQLKNCAVEKGDQDQATLIWSYGKILSVQNRYLRAFRYLKRRQHYDAWCLLEEIEIGISQLRRHFVSNNDDFRISFIEKHTRQLQSLYPYKYFMSPAYLILEAKCSTCDRQMSIRNPCGHRVGDIYDGEMCSRIVTKMRMLEISLVENPSQKYSVFFTMDSETGKMIDHYNYSSLNYLIDGLRKPFDAWDSHWTKARHPHSRYSNIGKYDDCPCESGETYSKCCLPTPGVLRPHLDITFSVPPPDHLPTLQYSD